MLRTALIILGIALATQTQVNALDFTWFEAEDFDQSNWPGGNTGKGPFAPRDASVKRGLSNGVWLNGAKGKEGLFLTKKIEIPANGKYYFFARCFGSWGGGTRSSFRWRLDDGPWTTYNQREGIGLESIKPTGVSTLTWIRFKKPIELEKGSYLFRLEILPPQDAKGFDCFVFATGDFVPNGKLKPGEKLGLADEGKWAFEPDVDEFSPEAMLDLRYLNEKRSGQDGWIHLSKDGEQLLLGSGKPVKLWSVETHAKADLESTKKYMRFLAKRGVNAVRYFRTIAPKQGQALTDINQNVRDDLWKLAAACRESGMYILFDPIYYKTWAIQKSWGIPDYQQWNTHRQPRHALYSNKEIQNAYKIWMKKTLSEKNPYTGIPLAQDPTLYCIQLQNEDGFFWSGVNWGLTKEGVRTMCKYFGDWLTKKYGSPSKALEAWGSKPLRGTGQFNDDNLNRGEVGLPTGAAQFKGYWLESMAKRPSTVHLAKRCRDAMIFIADFQRKFNTDMSRYIQKELGYKGLIAANNWQTQDKITLEDVERYTYTTCEIVSINRYVGVQHINPTARPKAGYMVTNNDIYIDDSPIQTPSSLPNNFKMAMGHPCIITESGWVAPRSYHAEGPLMLAAYGSLTGLDSYNWFAVGREWPTQQGKWATNIPGIQAGFPAAALLYRRGDVKEPKPVVYEQRSLDDLWDRRRPVIAESAAYDPNVNRDFVGGESQIKTGVDPLVFCVGPVRASYGAPKTVETVNKDLKKYYNRQEKWVKSITGELMLRYGKGLFTCNTPRSQAVTGFLKKNGGDFRLKDVRIKSNDDYACIIVTSLDDAPLATSKKVLLQVTTPSRPYGWREQAGMFQFKQGRRTQSIKGKKILKIGSMPWNMMKTKISVSIRNNFLKKATLLDANGMKVKDAAVGRVGKELRIDLPENVLYVVLQ